MYQVKIPLDMVWMDKNRRVVEMVENTPPCKTKASECPNYGGNRTYDRSCSNCPAGMPRKHGIREGRQFCNFKIADGSHTA